MRTTYYPPDTQLNAKFLFNLNKSLLLCMLNAKVTKDTYKKLFRGSNDLCGRKCVKDYYEVHLTIRRRVKELFPLKYVETEQIVFIKYVTSVIVFN